MRGVIQRVKSAQVHVAERLIGKIDKGLLVFVGIEDKDDVADVEYFCEKLVHLRIFEDSENKLNLSLLDIHGDIMVVSQFTLYGDCRKGRRPNFTRAAHPTKALEIYNQVIKKLSEYPINVASGQFQANMEVTLINDGPVTILLDSKKEF